MLGGAVRDRSEEEVPPFLRERLLDLPRLGIPRRFALDDFETRHQRQISHELFLVDDAAERDQRVAHLGEGEAVYPSRVYGDQLQLCWSE
jgi:hypothetical protein